MAYMFGAVCIGQCRSDQISFWLGHDYFFPAEADSFLALLSALSAKIPQTGATPKQNR
jgi:hypothetical protein